MCRTDIGVSLPSIDADRVKALRGRGLGATAIARALGIGYRAPEAAAPLGALA